MRSEWQEYTGFGELLCLVLAWTFGVAAVWIDYSTRDREPGARNVAVSKTDADGGSRLD